ncbi:MAG: N-acetyltransferase [Candidatus Thorarchaeota archaeon]|nr:MAG: N-acetyltransferase [Candidatus Thorarchaeota archaeon]
MTLEGKKIRLVLLEEHHLEDITRGWKHLNLRRIELSVYAFNERAKHVYEKLGFKEWGMAHEKYFIDGEYIDTHYLEIFREIE